MTTLDPQFFQIVIYSLKTVNPGKRIWQKGKDSTGKKGLRAGLSFSPAGGTVYQNDGNTLQTAWRVNPGSKRRPGWASD
jgi:hypothetical protein